ncbi:hypothetical protein K491DRAFT_693245 [Lophiostoma macrostomum CBS 122681]|uniref:NHL repeat-containing protein n=1 Tax=Lophiostoma macrostomum CBS 122681 TaxID=1314788 RepID=A0A6A6T5F7_9PLEO|nr:hypothetical protein K491DRAFT_693245 [Lophiostoma macrostomum CBS 122681]
MAHISHFGRAAALLSLSSITAAYPYIDPRHQRPQAPCASVNGTIIVNQLALYPENADFDFKSCLLYAGSLFNASLAIYNPYTATTKIVEFPNITHNPVYHLGGVAANPRTDLISIVVDAGAAFNTGGQDISGTNLLLLWDPVTEKELYRVNLTETTKGVYGAFQDVEFDGHGNVYVVGTYPGSILRVEANGTRVNEWWRGGENHTTQGTSGLATTANILLSNNNAGGPNGTLLRFDTTSPKGIPRIVPITPPTSIKGSDAIYLPPKYNGTVLLVAVNALGVQVLRSRDGSWEGAEGLGIVGNKVPEAQGALVTGTVQIGDRLYMIEEFFGDAQPGNRTQFPFVDITDKVEALL